jgi:general secretion pathway protein G
VRARGFTLVELLITVAIIATLASIAMPLSEVSAQREKEHQLRKALRDIRDALDAYKRASDEGRIVRAADQSGFPPTLSLLVEGVADAKSPAGAKIYFLRRIPRDPMHADESTSAANTWRLRSYDSPPDRPQPGKDVFDVFSTSDRIGLNGVPYREW